MHHPLIKHFVEDVFAILAILYACDRSEEKLHCLVTNTNEKEIRSYSKKIKQKNISGGIYLLLGYSSIDENLLRAYTNLGIQDTVRAFQHYLHNHIDNQVRMHLKK